MVHSIELGNVTGTHFLPLSNGDAGNLRDDCRAAIDAERHPRVVQHTSIIVLNVERGHKTGVVLFEIVLMLLFDFLPHYRDKVVPVRGTLHVVESQGVQKLVHYRSQPEATIFQLIGRQIQVLHGSGVADLREASPFISEDANVRR